MQYPSAVRAQTRIRPGSGPAHPRRRPRTRTPAWPVRATGTTRPTLLGAELSTPSLCPAQATVRRRLLRTDPAQRLQRPRLQPAHPGRRDRQPPRGLGERTRLPIGETQPQLQHLPIESSSPPTAPVPPGQPHRPGSCRAGPAGRSPCRPRPPATAAAGGRAGPRSTPRCAPAPRQPPPPSAYARPLRQLRLDAPRRPQLLGPAGRQIQRAQLPGRRTGDVARIQNSA